MFDIKGSVIRQYAVVITVNLSILCTGLSIAWPSPVLVMLSRNETTPLSRPVTENEGSWIVSIGFLTGGAANFLGCYLVDRIGRKYCVILGYIPRLLMCLILLFSTEVWMVLVGRAFSGICDAVTMSTVPMYASEIASKEIRGSLGTFLQIFASLGIVIMLCAGPFMEFFSINVMVSCFSVITLVPLFFVPDSPYFLYSKGRTDEALKVLLTLRETEIEAKDELKEYSLSENNQKISKKELLKNRIFMKTAAIGIIFGAGIQLVGFNAVSFYLQTVLESTQTSVRPEIASGVIGSIQLLASFSTTLVTDRFGRKPILAATLVGQAVGMVGLGVFFKLKEGGPVAGFLNYVPLISLILVVYCFSAGLGSLSWCLLAELFDGPTRAIGVTISMFTSVVFVFLTVKYFALVTITIGAPITYGIFSVNCLIMCLFVCYCVPETKGKTIAEIQEALGAKRGEEYDMKKQKYESNGRRDIKRQALIAMCLNLGNVLIGYTVCWPAPVIPKLEDPAQTPLDRPLTGEQSSWLAAILHVGVITGSQSGAFLSNVIGRKPTLILFATVYLISHIIRVSAANFTIMIVGRIVSGLGGGAIASGNLVYIGEIASSDLRGVILTATGVHHTFGSLLVFSVGPYVPYAVVEYIMIGLGLLHVTALFWIIESPVYHVIKGNDEAARNTLHYLGRSKDIDKEFKTMIENVKQRNIQYTQLNTKTILRNWTWLDIFRRKRNRRALLITATLLTIQEGAGIMCIMSFANTIFRKAASSINPDIATIILGVTQVVGIIVAPLLVERFGRRSLLIFSTSTCAFWMALMGVYFYLEMINHPLLDSIRWLPLATLISFLICYNAGLGIIPNVLVGEMFSSNVRSTGSSIAMCFSWVAAFLSALSFGYIIIIIGSHIMFSIFAIINAFGCFFTLKFVPETRGKSLTEIEAMLAK